MEIVTDIDVSAGYLLINYFFCSSTRKFVFKIHSQIEVLIFQQVLFSAFIAIFSTLYLTTDCFMVKWLMFLSHTQCRFEPCGRSPSGIHLNLGIVTESQFFLAGESHNMAGK